MKKKHILLISYFFAPRLISGVHRSNKFAKYLSKLGWKVTVLTTEVNPHYANSNDTLEDIPPEVEMIRIATPQGLEAPYQGSKGLLGKFKRYFSFPDERYLWAQEVLKYLAEHDFNYDIIFTTSPPVSLHKLGLELKQKYNVPWVADFRDPWLRNKLYEARSFLHSFFDRSIEKKVYAQADHIVENTQGNLADSLKAYPFLKGKADYIYNGYDDTDIAATRPQKKNEKMTVLYAGQLYGNYNAKKLFQVLKHLKQSDPKTYEQLQIEFYGKFDLTESFLRSQGLAEVIKLHSFISPLKLKDKLAEADAFLLFLPDNALSWVPQKLYIYLPQNKPILAFIPESGEAGAILKQCGTPILFSDNTHENTALLSKLIKQWQNGELIHFNSHDIEQYSRKNLTKKLSNILSSLTRT